MKKLYNIYADCGNYNDYLNITFENEKEAIEFCEMFINSKYIVTDRAITGKLHYKETYQYDNLIDYVKHNKQCIEYLEDVAEIAEKKFGTQKNKYNKLLLNSIDNEDDELTM